MKDAKGNAINKMDLIISFLTLGVMRVRGCSMCWNRVVFDDVRS